MSDESYVRVPLRAYKWLMGEEGDFEPPPLGPNSRRSMFWWRSEFQRRIKQSDGLCPDSVLDRASIPEMFNVLAGEIRGVNETLHRMRDVADSSHVRIGAIEARLSDLKVMDAHIDAQNQGLCNLFDLVSTELVPVRSRLAAIESQLSTFKDGTYERFVALNERQSQSERCAESQLELWNIHTKTLTSVLNRIGDIEDRLTALRAEEDKGREEGANHYEAIHTKFMEVYKRLTPMENRMADLQLSVDAMHGPKRGDVTGSIRGIDMHVKALAERLANSNRWQSEHECLLAAVHTLIVRQTKGTGRKKKQERKPGGRKSR